MGFIGIIGFLYILSMRYAVLGVSDLNINSATNPLMKYDIDNLLFSILGFKFGLAASIFTFYLTNGLYGLSLAF